MTDYLPTRNHPLRLFKLIIVLTCMVSCTVTNNVYVANPIPMGKGNTQGYIGLGSGMTAKIDSVNNGNGKIFFSNKISTAPVFSLGAQLGVSNQTDLRFALHLPYIIGGVGLRTGLQHSFLDPRSKINLAIGLDLGGVFARDSLRLFGSSQALNKNTNGGLSADIFIPFSVKFKNDILMVLTPRYSFNRTYIRKVQSSNYSFNFDLGYPALSLGVKKKKYYFEITPIYFYSKVYPHFGFTKLF